ncbi:alpha/beta hydrolase [Aureimonas leprariae]|uniref:Prolyl oligopeptidase family serine peptidase n=1 Tax=Plantimonas leprariae TaxID=2615207 RepID=A0A7V7PM10_9HYPH|nr:dienelactone hydrolase family protein [Aureimonas leprariae]KAB0677746.1 prolyl oligopeptidase family serine peptidase [Aureimonas leprariae]
MPDSLVVLLHGVGASGADLMPLGRIWARTLPDADFDAPDAPEPFDGGGPIRQWFSLEGVTPANRPARVAAARPAFDALVAGIVERHGFAGRLDRVAIVGFSQGATMALDAAMRGRWPVAAAVALSGRFASPEPLAPSPKTGFLIVHGAADPVVPATEGEHAATALRARGLAVRHHVLPGVGHEIAPEAMRLAGAFLAERLGAPMTA